MIIFVNRNYNKCHNNPNQEFFDLFLSSRTEKYLTDGRYYLKVKRGRVLVKRKYKFALSFKHYLSIGFVDRNLKYCIKQQISTTEYYHNYRKEPYLID